MKETFGQRFSLYRKKKGYTQEEIGERVGVSAQAVSKWENDVSFPDVTLLADLADILGVTVDALLGRPDPKEVRVLPPEDRGVIEKSLVKIIVNSADGDRVDIKLPIPLIRAFLEQGLKIPVGDNPAAGSVDFNQIMKLVEQGVVGELLTVETNDGDNVRILVE